MPCRQASKVGLFLNSYRKLQISKPNAEEVWHVAMALPEKLNKNAGQLSAEPNGHIRIGLVAKMLSRKACQISKYANWMQKLHRSSL